MKGLLFLLLLPRRLDDHQVRPGGRVPRTLIRSTELRWPDALSFGPDGYLYVADSALAELILQSPEHIKASGPYRIFRFRPGTLGTPGQ